MAVRHFASVRRPRGKQPRPETSAAGTAIPDSGHNRPQRGQNPGRSYARVCVCRARRARGKQPRPETSVARAAIPDSGHDRAQRGQNPDDFFLLSGPSNCNQAFMKRGIFQCSLWVHQYLLWLAMSCSDGLQIQNQM